jgi:hypothetical protein
MDRAEIRDKIMAGCKLAVKRLIERKKKENAFIIISKDGKVVKVPAAEIDIK